MYRVFESLDALVTVVEEARSLPMTSTCVVPRGDVLELLDDVREALPGELDDAQDVLDRRDEILGEAEQEVGRQRAAAQAEAEQILAKARNEAERAVADGRQQFTELTDRARVEADRLAADGQAAHERFVADGRTEQARLVGHTEVVRAAAAEAARIVDAADKEAGRLRRECDGYIDSTLAGFEQTLDKALRTVGRGRAALWAGSPHGPSVGATHGRTGTGMDLID